MTTKPALPEMPARPTYYDADGNITDSDNRDRFAGISVDADDYDELRAVALAYLKALHEFESRLKLIVQLREAPNMRAIADQVLASIGPLPPLPEQP